MGLAYEIVINSSPCISYLMEENTATMQTRSTELDSRLPRSMAEGEAGFEPSPRNSAWWKVIRRTVTAQPPLIASERPKQRVRLISGSSASTFPKLPCDSVGSCCPAVVPSCFYFPGVGAPT